MIKPISIVFFVFSTISLFAQTATGTDNESNTTLFLIILGVALLALVLSIINYFRISYLKKVSSVELINQKDDLNTSMEAIKVTLIKDIRGIKKDVSRLARVDKSSGAGEKKEKHDEKVEKKTVRKRPPYRRKPAGNNNDDQKNQ